jgi:hypothetical protein
MVKRLTLFAVAASLMCMIVSCSPSDGSLNNADKRIKDLKSKGVPDSALSPSLVYLYKARYSKEKSDWGNARDAAKQLRISLAQAEALYRDNISTLKPSIDSLVAIVRAAKANYSGIELKKVDSLLGIVDSFASISWLLQAHTRAQQLVAAIPAFNFDSDRSKELRTRVPGEWVCTNKTTSKENKLINAVEKKVFLLEKDGKAKLIESKKGQSGPYLKEDWEFNSWGTWDVNGDTVRLFINRFAAVRQNFHRVHLEEGGKKISWRNEPQPTYDSTITDGSQDRFITFTDLSEDFDQARKF